MVTVLVVDDNPVVRLGLRQLLLAQDGIDVVAEATNGEQAVTLAAEYRPDVILLDVRMPGRTGLEVLPELCHAHAVLMLTSSDEDDTIRAAMSAGARGYLVYGTFDEATIAQGIRAVAGGGSVLSPSAARVLVEAMTLAGPEAAAQEAPDVPPEVAEVLSPREIAVMEHLVAGRSNTEIALALFLSPKTVKNHINRIFSKLQVTTRAQAIALWAGTCDPAEGPWARPGAAPGLGPQPGPRALHRVPPGS